MIGKRKFWMSVNPFAAMQIMARRRLARSARFDAKAQAAVEGRP